MGNNASYLSNALPLLMHKFHTWNGSTSTDSIRISMCIVTRKTLAIRKQRFMGNATCSLQIAPDWRQALTLKEAVEEKITKDGVIGIGIAATAVGLVAGGIAAALTRSLTVHFLLWSNVGGSMQRCNSLEIKSDIPEPEVRLLYPNMISLSKSFLDFTGIGWDAAAEKYGGQHQQAFDCVPPITTPTDATAVPESPFVPDFDADPPIRPGDDDPPPVAPGRDSDRAPGSPPCWAGSATTARFRRLGNRMCFRRRGGCDASKTAFAKLLQSQTELEELFLMNDGISKEGAVFELVSSTERLKGIGSDVGKALSKALEMCTDLKKLDLRDNMFGVDGGEALSKALTKHENHSEIYLCYLNCFLSS
nr:RAN GTPase-activating protein 2 [Ipomoea batatas]